MRLHELEKGKVYIGEDGGEYSHNGESLKYSSGTVVTMYARLSQSFTPKKTKVKKTIKVERWANYYSENEIFYYSSKGQADAAAGSKRLACIKLTGEAEIEVEE